MSQIHPRARTTPLTRTEIHASKATLTELSDQYNITVATARKWKGRTDPQDRSHRPHTLHTTLTSAQEGLCCANPFSAAIPLTPDALMPQQPLSGNRVA